MSKNPELRFDVNDEPGVKTAIGARVHPKDPWTFACGLARKCFDELLIEEQPMTDYLGGRPLDSAITNGVLHPLYKGLGVVFVVGQPSGIEGGIGVRRVADVAIGADNYVIAKFWCAATAIHRHARLGTGNGDD